MKYKRAIYWFTNDLRLKDNKALVALSERAEEVCFIYVFNEGDFVKSNFQAAAIGHHRMRFILESLKEINDSLAALGHKLLVLSGKLGSVLQLAIDVIAPDAFYFSKQHGFDERKLITRLNCNNSHVAFNGYQQYTLFDLADILNQNNLFNSFSKFRKFVESSELEIASEANQHSSFPKSGITQAIEARLQPYLYQSITLEKLAQFSYFRGGHKQANEHINVYFSSKSPSTYKETRNALDEWSSSTKFSPYLAHGCLSPSQVWRAVDDYEANTVANDSTYWIKFELLWREYFQWLSLKQGKMLFTFGGQDKKSPLTSFYPERLRKWQAGNTPFALVNACMKQLNETGYMSNRGRQIVASCFVNELGLDWRYGAAYFQQQLIDYDVAANWGNWQYIAGVGADPRGGRHFNLDKQANIYDPNGGFITKWHGEPDNQLLDSVDLVDWPITKAV